MADIDLLTDRIDLILDNHDPIGLLNVSNYSREYLPEAKKIVEGLHECKNVEEVKNLVYGVFVRSFEYGRVPNETVDTHVDPGGAGTLEDYHVIAEQIFSMSRK